MSLFDILKSIKILARGNYILAVSIHDSKNWQGVLKEIAKSFTTDLTIVGSLLDNLQNFAHRVFSQDEKFLINNIDLLKSITNDAKTILKEVRRDRNFFQCLFMKNDEYRRQLREISKHLNNSCLIIHKHYLS